MAIGAGLRGAVFVGAVPPQHAGLARVEHQFCGAGDGQRGALCRRYLSGGKKWLSPGLVYFAAVWLLFLFAVEQSPLSAGGKLQPLALPGIAIAPLCRRVNDDNGRGGPGRCRLLPALAQGPLVVVGYRQLAVDCANLPGFKSR